MKTARILQCTGCLELVKTEAQVPANGDRHEACHADNGRWVQIGTSNPGRALEPGARQPTPPTIH